MEIREKSAQLISKVTHVAICANRDHKHYYERPHVALCGHSMCMDCWKIKEKCSTCDAPVNINELQEDDIRNKVVKLVRRNLLLFRKLHETGNHEITLPPSNIKEHVQSWLGSSQNHFSIPPTQTENIMPDATKGDITKQESRNKIIRKTIPQQELDLIQSIEESELDVSKSKDNNFVCLKDNTCPLDDTKVTKENNSVRRSTRRALHENSEAKQSNRLLTESVFELHNSPKKSNLTLSEEKSSDKDNIRKHWKNVKKMEKVFSGLNKRNVKKLNVSIEICNKKNIIPKSNECFETDVRKNTPYIIEEDTPRQDARILPSDKQKYKITKENVSEEIANKDLAITETLQINKNDETHCKKVPSDDKKNTSLVDKVSQSLGKDILPSVIVCRDSQEIDLPSVYIGTKKSGDNLNIDNIPQTFTEPECRKPQGNELPRASIRKRKLIRIKRPLKQCSRVQNKLINPNVFTKRGNQLYQMCNFQKRPMNKIGILNVSTPEGNFMITGENICVLKGSVTCTEKSTQTDNEVNMLKDHTIYEDMPPRNSLNTPAISNALMPAPLSTSIENWNDSQCNHEKVLAKPPEPVQGPATRTNTASGATVTGPFKITESVEKEMSNEMGCEEDVDIFHSCIANKPQGMATKIIHSECAKVSSQNITQKSKLRSKRLRQANDENFEIAQKRKKDDNENKTNFSHNDLINIKKNPHVTIEAPDQGRNSLTLEFDEITSKAFAQIDADLFEQRNNKNQAASDHDIHQQELPTSVAIDDNDDMLKNYSTPLNAQNGIYNVDSDSSFVEETPQKEKSAKTLDKDGTSELSVADGKVDVTMIEKEIIQDKKEGHSISAENTLESPLTLNHFSNEIVHESTPMRPVPRRSLDFSKTLVESVEKQLESSFHTPSINGSITSDLVRTTLEREFMERAFQKTPHITPVRKPMSLRKDLSSNNQQYVLAFSCLSSAIDKTTVKAFAKKQNWDFSEVYTPKLTHLIVGVDDNKANRTVKYIQALAASKWIVSIDWINQCIRNNSVVNEAPYEVLDMSGCNGPYLSRTATTKIFQNITFYCHPPFSMFEPQTLEDILVTAGGKVVKKIEEVSLKRNIENVALVLAEPENTADEKYIYLAIDKSVVPVNYEWALNSLGSYSLQPLSPTLLCSVGLVHFDKLKWPQQLLVDAEDSAEPDEIESE